MIPNRAWETCIVNNSFSWYSVLLTDSSIINESLVGERSQTSWVECVNILIHTYCYYISFFPSFNLYIYDDSKLRDAVLECISIVLQRGNIDALAALFDEKGQDVNPKLKQLVGQVFYNRLLCAKKKYIFEIIIILIIKLDNFSKKRNMEGGCIS